MKLGVSVTLMWFLLLCSFFGVRAAQNEMSFDYFTQESGLPNNKIQVIYQDQKGWMWFGTSQGLSRFDGYEFVNYNYVPGDTTCLQGVLVRAICEDQNGNLLVGTENGGLNVFDRDLQQFRHPYADDPHFKGKEVSVNDIQKDSYGNLWLGTNNSILVIDTLGDVKLLADLSISGTDQLKGNYVRELQFDTAGKLWAGTNRGVFIIDLQNKTSERLKLPLKNGATDDEIWEIFADKDGSMWIGTYSNGAFIVNPETGSMKSVKLKPELDRTKTVRTISTGPFGNYWIGTRGGLYVYNKSKGMTAFYHHDDQEMGSLVNNSVLDIFHDRQGGTWIGTRGGLNLLAKSKQVFHNFGAHPSDDDHKYLNSSIVYTFWIDSLQNIWIGTEDGGINIYHPKTESYTYLKANDHDPNSISRNCVKALAADGRGNLWIATFLGGVDVLNLKTRHIKHFKHDPNDSASLVDNRVWDFLLDDDGSMWVATSSGIDRFDLHSHKFIHYPQLCGSEQVTWIKNDSNKNIWMGSTDEVVIYNPKSNNISRYKEHSRSFLEDSKGRTWITTLDRGIVQYSSITGPLRDYSVKDGLSNNQALCILEDNNHNLWISTSNGLSKFNPETKRFINYYRKDGLRNNQYTYGAACKAPNGDMLFGGISGFTIFNPDIVRSSDQDAPLVLTDFRVFNKKVKIGQGENAILKRSISETTHIDLDYTQNVFTLEFVALNYSNSQSNLYSYYLEGFDKGWNEPSTNRSATYTNLNPGNYVLHVKRVIPGEHTSDRQLQVAITILPPFWKTIWFRVLIFLVISGLIYLLVYIFLYRARIKNELVLERMKASKLHELDMLKLKFFTSISHEIRTPLTLILAPLEKLVHKKVKPEETSEHMEIMYRNAKNLDRLINQLLDFRKLESGNLKLELRQGDLVPYLSGIVQSFTDYAREKEIDLKFKSVEERLITCYDPDKVEKIVNNLLSNALKFTGEGGRIRVNLSLVFDPDQDDLSEGQGEQKYIEITVRDTGRGISQKNVNRIFNWFVQGGDKESRTGSGIGLAFVKELVSLHGGKISVVSEPGKGSKFIVRLPYKLEEQTMVEVSDELQKKHVAKSNNEPKKDDGQAAKVMLIIEDNPDVRALIRNQFAGSFQVFEAGDGIEGWRVALETVPDVIISDVLMPDMDGFEFCRKIKKDERTSHIPVLLLTALHAREHEIKGLSAGADDYITKPFDLMILQTKVENMLSVRDSLKEKFSGEMTLQPKNIVIASPDEKFLQKVIEVVEKNISDADLDIEHFSQEVGVSRMQLYRKLKALTDMTVKEFIRNIRLKRASQLLLQEHLTVSEIAYSVGFKDLSHFRKCFRQQYGMSATEYKQKHTSGEPVSEVNIRR